MGPIIGNIIVDFYYYYIQFTCPKSLAENYPYITYKVFGTLLNFYLFIGVTKVMSSKAESYILTQNVYYTSSKLVHCRFYAYIISLYA